MTMNRNIPLSIDNELLEEIDRVAEKTKESRSAIMRRAIREGLPIIQTGTSADVVALDSELSQDVDHISKEGNLTRAKVMIECIRKGAQSFYNQVMREKVVHCQDHTPEEAAGLLLAWEHSDRMHDPMSRELRMGLRQRGAAIIRLWDILMHVPEAWRRHQLIEKLTSIRQSPGGGGGAIWGHGLSTREIEWQIELVEKYGIGGKVPAEEVAARNAERESEAERAAQQHRDKVGELLRNAYPLDWAP